MGPVQAHDEVTGPAAVTISAGDRLDDRDVTVRSGDIIAFVNADGTRHRFRSTSGPGRFDTGNLESGETGKVRLTAIGTYRYRDERDRDDARYHGVIRVAAAPAAAATTPPATGGESTAPRAVTVTIGDRVFLPGTTTLAAGGTVTFENDDGDEHTATSAGGGPIDSGTLGQGEAYQVTLPEPGTFAFLCLIHPDMRGTIEVVAADTGEPSAPVASPVPATPEPSVAPSPAPTAVPVTPAPTATPPLDAEPADAVEVAIEDFAFDAPSVTVAAGGSVTWTNVGDAPHTVTASDGSYDSGTLESDIAFVRTFDTVGTYGYICAIHPAMTGTVEVVEAKQATVESRPPSSSPPAAAVAGVTDTSSPPPDPIDAGGRVAAATVGAPVDLESSLRVLLAVVLVSVAIVLFLRTMRGAVRVADRP